MSVVERLPMPAIAHGERSIPLQRLEALCDPGSLRLIRTAARSPHLGDRARDGDGVLAGQGTVGGRPVLCYADDPAMLGGSLGAVHAGSILEVLRLAERSGRPVVGFVSSAGARLQDGLAALHGYGEIFAAMTRLSGRVPQISVVSGLSAGGGAYAPALGDFVVMTEEASMFLTGPGVVREVMGEDVDAAGLGGPRVQAANGVCHFLAPDPDAGAALARDLLDLLPGREGERPEREIALSPLPGDPGDAVPENPRKTSTTSARSSSGSSTPAGSSSTASAGRATSAAPSAASTAARWGSSPTSRATSAACSTPRPPRRPRASCAPATCSACR